MMCYAKGAVVNGVPYPNGLRCKPRGRVGYHRSLAKCVQLVNSPTGQISKCKTLQDLTKTTSGRTVLKGLVETKIAVDINQQKRETLMDCNANLPDFVKDTFINDGRIAVTRPHERFDGSKALHLIEAYNADRKPGDPDYIDVEKYKDHIVDVSTLSRAEQRKLLAAGILQKTGKKQFTIKDTASFLVADDETKPDQYVPSIHSHKARVGGKSDEHTNLHPSFVGSELGRYKKEDFSYREALHAFDKASKAHDVWVKENPNCEPPVDRFGKKSYPISEWEKYGDFMKEADKTAKEIINHNQTENEKLSDALYNRFAKGDNDLISQTVAFTPHSNLERELIGTDSAGRAKYKYTHVGSNRDGKPVYSSKATERFAVQIQDKRDKETLDVLVSKGAPLDVVNDVHQILHRPGAKFSRERNSETNINSMFATTALISKELDRHVREKTITASERDDFLSSIKSGDSAARELIRSAVDPKFEITIGQKVKKGVDEDGNTVSDREFVESVKKLNFAEGEDVVRVVSTLTVNDAKALVADHPGRLDGLVSDAKIPVRGSIRVK